MRAAQMAAMEHMTGDVYRVGCNLERELNSANTIIRQQQLLDEENLRLQDRIHRLESALREIANQDYRGNRSTESQIAFRALEAKP
jgi:RNA polymerase-binding transcription factor DksA